MNSETSKYIYERNIKFSTLEEAMKHMYTISPSNRKELSKELTSHIEDYLRVVCLTL